MDLGRKIEDYEAMRRYLTHRLVCTVLGWIIVLGFVVSAVLVCN